MKYAQYIVKTVKTEECSDIHLAFFVIQVEITPINYIFKLPVVIPIINPKSNYANTNPIKIKKLYQ